ncbi:MAG: DUF456 domain-containing protein [Bacteroidales bacterium]|nr:DUF456 domain-containing protein [Bacteroidales bacterium]
MDYILAFISILCAITGILGAFLPVLPGPPISFVGIVILQFTKLANFSPTFIWIMAISTILVTVLDYIAPAWMTDKFGGSKYATNGSIIGLIAGIFLFPPVGMIIGPFIGAFIGELLYNKDTIHALKIAFLSFLAFLIGTGLKFILCAVMLFYIIKEIVI